VIDRSMIGICARHTPLILLNCACSPAFLVFRAPSRRPIGNGGVFAGHQQKTTREQSLLRHIFVHCSGGQQARCILHPHNVAHIENPFPALRGCSTCPTIRFRFRAGSGASHSPTPRRTYTRVSLSCKRFHYGVVTERRTGVPDHETAAYLRVRNHTLPSVSQQDEARKMLDTAFEI
jgi:hypothetical protein